MKMRWYENVSFCKPNKEVHHVDDVFTIFSIGDQFVYIYLFYVLLWVFCNIDISLPSNIHTTCFHNKWTVIKTF